MTALDPQWQKLGVHRASRQAQQAAVSTGWPALDALLPGGGYPMGAVTELLVERTGIGETSLLLDMLRARLAARPGQRLALIAPPASLNAPAFIQAGLDCARLPVVRCRNDAERVWCVEQMAVAGGFAAFVVWGDRLDMTALRRLQLAAEKAVCPVFVYRDLKRAAERSPAALRLAVTGRSVDGRTRQRLEVLKCRGPAGARIDSFAVDDDQPWQLPRQHDVRASRIRVGPARNDSFPNERTHVARPSFSPLGAR